jgi:hypothetical protein
VYKNGMSPAKTLFEEVGEVMPFYKRYSPYPENGTLFALSYNDQEREALILEWEEIGIIPRKLQYKILVPNISVMDYTKKLP